MGELPYLLLGVCATLIGAWFLRKVVREVRLGRRSHTWPTAPGVVTHAEAKYDDDGDHTFHIEYRFDVDGVQHYGEVLQIGHPTKSRAQIRELNERYPVGTAVPVYFDPADPSTAVLVPGPGAKIAASATYAVVLFGVGIYCAVAVAAPHPERGAPGVPGAQQMETPLPKVPYYVLNDPTGVAVAADGAVYVCDGPPSTASTQPNPPSADEAGSLLRMTPDLLHAKTMVPGQLLHTPRGLAVDNTGKMYVSDRGQLWVYAWGDSGFTGSVPLASVGVSGVAVDSAGTVFVTEPPSGPVLRLPKDAQTATVFFKTPDNGSPADVAVDNAGNVYVTDSRNNRVFKIAPDGSPIELPFQNISRPAGVAVDAAGNVYVVDAGNHRVMKLAMGSQSATDLLLDGLTDPYDVAVDKAGHVFVTDRGSHLLLKFPPPQ